MSIESDKLSQKAEREEKKNKKNFVLYVCSLQKDLLK